MLRLFITNANGRFDYSKYVDWKTVSLTNALSAPTQMKFSCYQFDQQFVAPFERCWVELFSGNDARNIFTGYVAATPDQNFIALGEMGQVFKFDVTCTSDEYLLNFKYIEYIPAFINQTQGQILAQLAEILAPGFYDTSLIQPGQLVPYMQYDPTKTWANIAKTFADSARYYYFVRDKQIIYAPYGDAPLGLSYDEINTPKSRWNSQKLATTVLQVPTVNDVTVIGDTEAAASHDDYYIGDGFTGEWNLNYATYQSRTALLLQDDFTQTSMNTQNWTLNDPQNNFDFSAGALNLVTPTSGPTLTGQLIANNGLELAGGIELQHGEFQFNDKSIGEVGGMYFDASMLQQLAAFNISTPDPTAVTLTASGAGGIAIQPSLSGTLVGPQFITQPNHHYVLKTKISAPSETRFQLTFATKDGKYFSGQQQVEYGDITFSIEDVDIGATYNQSLTGIFNDPVSTTTLFTATGALLPAYAAYGLIKNGELNLTTNYCLLSKTPAGRLKIAGSISGAFLPTGAILPFLGPESEYFGPVAPALSGQIVLSSGVTGSLAPPTPLEAPHLYTLGFGLDEQVASVVQQSSGGNNNFDSLGFYLDTTPAAGSRIKFRANDAQRSISRVIDQTLVSKEAALVGDDGRRAAVVTNMNPLPRTSEDCDAAAQAYLSDRGKIFYNGSYTAESDLFSRPVTGDTDFPYYPIAGRFININCPARNLSNAQFLVTQIVTSVLDSSGELLSYALTFGADTRTEKLLADFAPQAPTNIFTPGDSANQPLPQSIAAIVTGNYLPDIVDTELISVVDTVVWLSVHSPFITAYAPTQAPSTGNPGVSLGGDSGSSGATGGFVDPVGGGGGIHLGGGFGGPVGGGTYSPGGSGLTFGGGITPVYGVGGRYGTPISSSGAAPYAPVINPQPLGPIVASTLRVSGPVTISPQPTGGLIGGTDTPVIQRSGPISVFAATNYLGYVPIPGDTMIEVRLSDVGWGQDTANLVARYYVSDFMLTKNNYDQTWYMRFVQFDENAQPIMISRRSKVVRIRYPLRPTPPTIVTASTVDMQLDFSGDQRNIYGIEVRAADDKTVMFQQSANDTTDLYFNLQQVANNLGAQAQFSQSSGYTKTSAVVTVPGNAYPWNPNLNTGFYFGNNSGTTSTLIPVTAGLPLALQAEGLVYWDYRNSSTSQAGPGGSTTPSQTISANGTYLPFNYFQSSGLGQGGLCGTFVDGSGVIVGAPFAIGASLSIDSVPAGAVALSLGINDDVDTDNSGYFSVTGTLTNTTVTNTDSSINSQFLGRGYTARFFNAQWLYSDVIGINTPVPPPPILSIGVRFSQMVQINSDVLSDRDDILQQTLEISYDNFNTVTQTIISEGQPGSWTFSAASTGDVWCRSRRHDLISAGDYSSVLHVPQGDLIASDYLATQGSVPPIVTNNANALFSYISTTGQITIMSLGFGVVFPNQSVGEIAPTTGVYTTALSGTVSFPLTAASTYGYFPRVDNPLNPNAQMEIGSLYVSIPAGFAQTLIQDGRVLLSQTALSCATASVTAGDGGGSSGGGTGTGGDPGTCTEENELVTLYDGSKIKGKDLMASHILKTANGERGYIRKIALTNNVQLYRVTTESGRTIQASEAHAFRVNRRWASTAEIAERLSDGEQVLMQFSDGSTDWAKSVELAGRGTVMGLWMKGRNKTYYVNDFECHNQVFKPGI